MNWWAVLLSFINLWLATPTAEPVPTPTPDQHAPMTQPVSRPTAGHDHCAITFDPMNWPADCPVPGDK